MRWRACLAIALLPLASATARAEARTGHEALLAEPAKDSRPVIHDMLWQCQDRRCTAPTGHSRPVIICMAMARQLGPVAAFSTDGAALDEQELARCNAARAAQATASAR